MDASIIYILFFIVALVFIALGYFIFKSLKYEPEADYGSKKTGKKRTENIANESEVLKRLKLRYAKGEITKNEYQEMRKEFA